MSPELAPPMKARSSGQSGVQTSSKLPMSMQMLHRQSSAERSLLTGTVNAVMVRLGDR